MYGRMIVLPRCPLRFARGRCRYGFVDIPRLLWDGTRQEEDLVRGFIRGSGGPAGSCARPSFLGRTHLRTPCAARLPHRVLGPGGVDAINITVEIHVRGVEVRQGCPPCAGSGSSGGKEISSVAEEVGCKSNSPATCFAQ